MRPVETATESGCYVNRSRDGELELLAMTVSDPPSRHELDALFSLTCVEAIACGWLIVTNPMPADALPLEIYGELVADAKANGCRTLVDLSSPRLESALRGKPDVVKLNDWELAEFVSGPVSTPDELFGAAQRLRDAGAGSVIVTRGERPAVVLQGDDRFSGSPRRSSRERSPRGVRRLDDGRAPAAAGRAAQPSSARSKSAPRPARPTSCAMGWAARPGRS